MVGTTGPAGEACKTKGEGGREWWVRQGPQAKPARLKERAEGNGGYDRDRTCDHYDVNVVLYR